MDPGLIPGDHAVQGSYISANIDGNGRWGTAGIGGPNMYSASSWVNKVELEVVDQ